MKGFKGTPGEWHVMRGDVLDKNGRMVALIEGFCSGESEIYDAKLIAAAPDLLEALQNMVTAYEYEASIDNPALLAARAAISKGLGEE
ncbi:hypothetical protein [Enterobacter roggenkampii]|uniref:hypothetical protein n=1 Tax=Enterobacter cloacae complex TaxID=354276 RepID=UPI0005EFF94A|nr:hypothetical protein [Enterobacter roggenkampii]KJP82010.1 hypothetical protein SR65_14100 [Enterobacter roggenkampii]